MWQASARPRRNDQNSSPVTRSIRSWSASVPESGQGGGFHLNQKVRHPKFGEGVVLNSEGRGAAARIQVKFHGEGTKWLVLAYAKLEPLG